MSSKSTRRRHRLAAERAARTIEGGLPMSPKLDVMPTAEVPLAERFEYGERRRQHLVVCPDYDRGWERPTPETADAVYDLLWDHLPAALRDRLDTIHPDPLTAQQLVVVALDLAVSAGRYGVAQHEKRDPEIRSRLRNVRRAVTRTRLFDAIARRWSDNYRQVRECGQAFSVSQMARSTIEAVHFDLWRLSIGLPVIWNLLLGRLPGRDRRVSWPLFTLSLSRREGYVSTLTPGSLLDEFERLMQADPVYGPTRIERAWRLWIEGRPRPSFNAHPPIVAERSYNVPTIGAGTQEVLRLQEDARIVFFADMFAHDFEQVRTKHTILHGLRTLYPTKDETDDERRLYEWERRFRAFELEFQAVYDQVQDLRRAGYPLGPFGAVPVRSAFVKVLNRRYQPMHMSPMSVSNRLDYLDFDLRLSPRQRWFGFAGNRGAGLEQMVSLDVSSSQTQILAIFLGDADLERDAVLSPIPFKTHLAERAWERLCGDGDTPDDPGFVDAIKLLWMRLGYGSSVYNVVRALDPASPGDYVDDTRMEALQTRRAALTDSATDFLAMVPGFAVLEQFRNLCRYIGNRAGRGTAGLTVTDPLDLSEFTWDPIQFADTRLTWNAYEISIVEPGKYPGGKCPVCGARKSTRRGARRTCLNKDKTNRHTWPVAFEPSVADETGEWPLRKHKLRNTVAPSLVHMLDSLYAACVMRELHARGVRDFVSLHDCWYAAEVLPDGRRALDVLQAAMEAAGRPWLLALGPVYDFLARHLVPPAKKETRRDARRRIEWADLIETARQHWKDRVSREDWPRFSFSAS